MKTYLDCYPCFIRQTLDAARYVEADENQQYRLLHQVLDKMRTFKPASTAPEMAYTIHQLIRQEMAVTDPYRTAKQASTRQALALYPRLKALVAGADDPLAMAVRLSIAGNIIDLGVLQTYDLEETIERVLAEPLPAADLAAFRAALAGASWILYLADNAGETVFDRILIEQLSQPVTYVVKSGPILNDAIWQDALEAGLEKLTTIVDNGSDAPGTVLHLCSPAFRRLLNRAELIIAKGQANYETLSELKAPVFFLLQAKCPVVARDLAVPPRSIVLRQNNGK
jgi:uncharacterized protein with ATP-grasp and redox domains